MGASQIDEGITFNVAGGLMLEHPLTLPFVEAVVSYLALSRTLTLRSICMHNKAILLTSKPFMISNTSNNFFLGSVVEV